jgi:hypothetical protein
MPASSFAETAMTTGRTTLPPPYDNVDRAGDSLGCEQDRAVIFADNADAGGVSVVEEAV